GPCGPRRTVQRKTPRSVDRDVSGLGIDGDLVLVRTGGDVELVLDHAVVVLELPPAQLAIALRRGQFERLVVGHGRVEVDGLLLVVGGLVLHLGDLTGDRVDHDLVIGGAVQDLDVPLPGPGALVVVELDRVQRALTALVLRGGDRVLRLDGRGVGAQIGARAVVAGVRGGVSPVVGPAVIAHAAAVAGTAVITGPAVVAGFGGRGV